MANEDEATMGQTLDERAQSAQRIVAYMKESINGGSAKVMSGSFSTSNHYNDDIYDITSSMDTMSNSDSKSRHTTFSAPMHHRIATSPSSTTPSQSRARSPAPSRSAMEADLCGIGIRGDLTTDDPFEVNLPIRAPYDPVQAFDLNTESRQTAGPARSIPTSGCNQSGIRNTGEDEGGSTPRPSTCSCSPSLGAAHGLAGESQGQDKIVIYENHSGCGDSEGSDDDLALERTADAALTEWFGISLSRLTRPVRVVCAFESIKEQCVNILQDEGHYMHDDQDDGHEYHDPQEGADHGRDAPPRRTQMGIGAISKSFTTKRTNDELGDSEDEDVDTGSIQGCQIKTSRSKKKCRGLGGLSCPYRKRNPRRFNIRDHEACANRSYSDMSKLKKHLTAEHFKPSCFRCHQSFKTAAELLPHAQRCPVQIRSSTQPPQTNPEDGFDEGVDDMLKKRKAGEKVDNWETLYKLLFGENEIVPSSDFEPVYEHHEVAYRYKSEESVIHKRVLDMLIKEFSGQGNTDSAIVAQKSMTLFKQAMVELLKDSKYLGEVSDPRMLQQTQSPEHDFVDLGDEDEGFLRISQSLPKIGASAYASRSTGTVDLGNELQQPMENSECMQPFIDQTYRQARAFAPQHQPMINTAHYSNFPNEYGASNDLPQFVNPISLSAYDTVGPMVPSETNAGIAHGSNDAQEQLFIEEQTSSMQCLSSRTGSGSFGQFGQTENLGGSDMSWEFGTKSRMR